MNKIKVGILGATGYAGVELARRLVYHPEVELSFVSSQSYAGQKFSEVFPELLGMCDATLVSPDEALSLPVDCLFSCLPHAASAKLCIPYIEKGVRVIDLSADFRIRDEAEYTKWYKEQHPCPQYLAKAVFGLPEHYRGALRNAQICANPGCYSTSIMLPLIPLYKNSSTQIRQVIADSKSGVSGAGRSLKVGSLFCEANENFTAYSIGHAHRHLAEIEQELTSAAKKDVSIIFSPHLVPMSRGILSTLYIQTNRSAAECRELAASFYKAEPFVRVRSSTDLPSTKGVMHTNYCDIAFTEGNGKDIVIAVSVVDNLIKGASGQAIQNMNIMFGFPETQGLVR